MTTDEQHEANKQNALRSTGPKNTGVTKFNSLKHGLSAKTIILKNPPFFESEKEYEMLRNQLNDEHQPKTITEEFLVGLMCEAMWKMTRARKAEHVAHLDKVDQITKDIIWHNKFSRGMHDNLEIGTIEIEERLSNCAKNIEKLKERDKATMEKFTNLYPGESVDSIISKLNREYNIFCAISEEKERKIQEEIRFLTKKANVPSESDFDLISRYFTNSERQFYRAFRELKNLRGMPAVEVTVEK